MLRFKLFWIRLLHSTDARSFRVRQTKDYSSLQLIGLGTKDLKELNNLLTESIDETITLLLSRQVTDALYFHLNKSHSITKDEVPYRLDPLLSTLEKTFGTSSRTIQKAITRKLYSKLNLTFQDNPDRSLAAYIEDAKAMLQAV
jgi:hypothetical protein